MLRASSKPLGQRIDAAAAVRGEAAGVAHGALLVGFVDAATSGDSDQAAAARAELAAAAGAQAVVDAAAVLANFEMMTRVADATGAVQLPVRLETLAAEREALGLDRFQSSR